MKKLAFTRFTLAEKEDYIQQTGFIAEDYEFPMIAFWVYEDNKVLGLADGLNLAYERYYDTDEESTAAIEKEEKRVSVISAYLESVGILETMEGLYEDGSNNLEEVIEVLSGFDIKYIPLDELKTNWRNNENN